MTKLLVILMKQSNQENQYEAGLQFTISYKKNIDFVGKKALLKIKDKTLSKKLIILTLQNSKLGEPLMLHDEPIYLEDKIIGRTTSGNYSFNFKKNLAFGYVSVDLLKEELKNKKLYIEIAKTKYTAELQPESLNQKNFKSI